MAASVARNGLKALCGVVIVAALAMTSTAKAGLIGTGSASYCDPTAVQVFSPWNDSSSYASLFNGGFEGGSAGWYLSGGARVVSGNEPFYVESSRDSHSLLVPEGSSATSGTVCFAAGDWHLRLFAKNTGSRTGSLQVQVVVPSLLGGLLAVLDGGTISGDGVWGGSPPAPRAPAVQRHRPARHEGGRVPLHPDRPGRGIPDRRRLSGSLERPLSLRRL